MQRRDWIRNALIALSFGLGAAACSGASSQEQPPQTATAADPGPVEANSVAYYAGGCFWGVEHFLEKLPGVASVESGYMGGHIDNPSYEQVSGRDSGHLESVRVNYDNSKIDYEAITRRFFEIHDPTQANGQGPDIGPQYLSAVFVANDQERAITEKLMAQLRARDYEVVTEVKPVTDFYDAEDYHQDYYVKHESKPYCHVPVDRFGDGA